jgi:hypothetical protein
MTVKHEGGEVMNRTCILLLIVLVALFNIDCSGSGTGVTRELAAHWAFDELAAGDSETPDSSGNNHHGRIFGQTLVPGIIGKAMIFEGYDQIVNVGNLGLNAPATVTFWVKTHDVFRDRRIMSQLDGTEKQAGALRFDGTCVEVWDGTEWQALIDRRVKINTWMHIAVVFEDGGRTAGYLDGERQHLVRSDFDYDGVSAGIGSPFLGESGNNFTGMLDDFRIYGTALTSEEIHAISSRR